MQGPLLEALPEEVADELYPSAMRTKLALKVSARYSLSSNMPHFVLDCLAGAQITAAKMATERAEARDRD